MTGLKNNYHPLSFSVPVPSTVLSQHLPALASYALHSSPAVHSDCKPLNGQLYQLGWSVSGYIYNYRWLCDGSDVGPWSRL